MNKNLKIIILAAGRGSRLKRRTNSNPKYLTRVNGKSIFDWQFQIFKELQIKNENIYIVAGYKSEKINFKNKIINKNWRKSNMLYSLLQASEVLKNNNCIVCYGDILFKKNVLKKLNLMNNNITIVYDKNWEKLWKKRFKNIYSDAENFKINNKKRILEIGGKLKKRKTNNGQYIGLMKFNKKIWKKINLYLSTLKQKDLLKMDMTTFFSKLISNKFELKGLPINGSWVEIDSTKDIKLYEKLLKIKDWPHKWF